MQQYSHRISIATKGQRFYEFTDEVTRWVRQTGIQQGLLTVYIQHTSASLVIQENADPDVRRDMLTFFRRLVADGDPLFIHTIEGPDDMPAHIKSALTSTSLSIPVLNGAPAFGTWQGIYLFEHRTAPHTRSVVCHLLGD